MRDIDSPAICILHLYHEHAILLKVVVIRYDVWVIQHAQNLHLQKVRVCIN